MEEGKLKYWNIGHCVDEILTSNFHTNFFSRVCRPLLKRDEDSQVVRILPWLEKRQVQAVVEGEELRPPTSL